MKTIIYISLALAFGTVSCVKLREKPDSFITTGQFYQTSTYAVDAVNAAYFLLNSGGNAVQTPYNTLFSTGMDMMTDDINPGPGATNPDVRSQAVLGHASSGLRVYQLWQQHYAGIKKTNVAIDNIPAIDFDPKVKNRLIGEAKFLRALYYFNLVRLYGDVPLVLHDQTSLLPADLNVTRTPTAQVYAQIIQDLNQAADALPLPSGYAASDVGRATQGAAYALLSKVYLTQYNWEKAIEYADKVIDGPYGYNLFADYSQVFLPANKNGVEHIFSAQFKSNSQGQGNNQAPRGARKGVPGIIGSYADQVVFCTVGKDKSFSVYKLYKSIDQRRNRGTFATMFQGTDGFWYGDTTAIGKGNNGGGYTLYQTNSWSPDSSINFKKDFIPYLNKYWDPNSSANLSESAANVPIIRFADILLIRAEAENELNGATAKAYASLKRVRDRAGLPDLTPGLDQNAFRDSVYLDRRLELIWENQRWFDLIRQRDATGNRIMVNSLHLVGKTNALEKHYLYPIPQQEIQLDPNLTQNPGW